MAVKTKRKSHKKKSIVPVVIAVSVLLVLIAAVAIIYFVGRARYTGKFLPNTFINNTDVSGKTLTEAQEIFDKSGDNPNLTVIKRDGTKVEIPFDDFGYKNNSKDKVKEILDKQNAGTWFMGYAAKSDYYFEADPIYDRDKMKLLLKTADWGSAENENAQIVFEDSGFEIVPEVQGDNMDYQKLEDYVLKNFDQGTFTSEAEASGCYIAPEIKESDLQSKCDKLNKIYDLKINNSSYDYIQSTLTDDVLEKLIDDDEGTLDNKYDSFKNAVDSLDTVAYMKITYDFDYTTETLEGQELLDMIELDPKTFAITANRDKAMKYVEKLAKKYDTYDKPRKFHATLQGDITVAPSDDAKYGWWIYQDATCDALVEMLEAGQTVESVDPIYYSEGDYFTYTGVEEARKKNDDIGKTYIEVDLTAQHMWYYKKGKLDYEADIVSGQTTSLARTTLPGVYKLWSKDTNHRMKDTNGDGESWDVTCSYWNNISLCGIGMHDSQWRGNALGGNIYKWNGSHGCINMTYNGAKYIYDNVPLGTPVVMYYKDMDSDAETPYGL